MEIDPNDTRFSLISKLQQSEQTKFSFQNFRKNVTMKSNLFIPSEAQVQSNEQHETFLNKMKTKMGS